MSRHVVVGSSGDLCPRCGQPTEIREHRYITAKQLRKDWYYSRWFYCRNLRCRTTVIVPNHYRVFNVAPEAEHRMARIAEQLGLSSDWISAASSAEVPW